MQPPRHRIRYLHANHQGSVIAHSVNNGVVMNKLSYDSYGIPSTDNEGRFGYTGQLWFKELGLNYYKARIYSPKLGRFLQTDPIFYADNMNMYAYVGNDPVNKIDPFGMYECSESDGVKTCEGTSDEMDDMMGEMDGYKISGATDGFSDTEHWEKIKSDVSSIEKKFNEVVSNMNAQGLRREGSGTLNGGINNILGYYGAKDYMGCTDQTISCLDALNNDDFLQTLNDEWKFESKYREMSIFNPFPHNWVGGKNTNAAFIYLNIDAWKNSFLVNINSGKN